MSCYHPMLGVRSLTPNPETGKYPVKIFKGAFDPKLVEVYGRDNILAIPCGKCIGCRLKYSRIWADRCMAEASYYENNCFLTLTYNNEHLPEPREGSPMHPLVKRDLQLFIKRLRKRLPDQKIRYFACGEYGSKNGRPHYHIILFNCKLDDVELLVKNEREFRYYTSKLISDCWKDPQTKEELGFHIITKVNWNTCAYVARYVVKKQTGKNADIYEKYNYPPEFTLMSRKPGIGRKYFEDHAIDIYYHGSFINTEEGSHRINPNKYYDSLFDIEYPDCNVVLKEDQKIAIENNNKLKSNLTSLSYYDMLKSEEENKLAKTRILQRKEV